MFSHEAFHALAKSTLDYVQHRPGMTFLYQVVQEYWPELRAELASQGKFLPTYVAREFEACVNCGRLEHGFVRIRCARIGRPQANPATTKNWSLLVARGAVSACGRLPLVFGLWRSKDGAQVSSRSIAVVHGRQAPCLKTLLQWPAVPGRQSHCRVDTK